MEANTTTQKFQAWLDSYKADLRTAEPVLIRIRYGLGHHYRDWLDDRADEKK